MFLLKKIIAPFLLPVSFCFEVLLIGLMLMWFTKKQKLARVIITLGVLLFLLFSYNPFGNLLLEPLEYRYSLPDVAEISDIKWIVVLGGGHTSDSTMSLVNQLSFPAVVRLTEAIRLHKMMQNSYLIMSGGGPFDPVPHAELLTKLAIELGVQKERIITESDAKDTKDEARIISEIVNQDPFLLVTSASHLPRAIALFKKYNCNPIPAPAGYMCRQKTKISPGLFFPGAGALNKTQRAIYEYLGIAWAKLRGQTK